MCTAVSPDSRPTISYLKRLLLARETFRKEITGLFGLTCILHTMKSEKCLWFIMQTEVWQMEIGMHKFVYIVIWLENIG